MKSLMKKKTVSVAGVSSRFGRGHVADLVSRHMNGSILFRGAMKQTTETMPQALK